MELKWLKNPGNLPYVLSALPLVSVATILAFGQVISEKWTDFMLWLRGREYFERRMLRDWFPDLSEDEKALMRTLTKEVLDKAFPT